MNTCPVFQAINQVQDGFYTKGGTYWGKHIGLFYNAHSVINSIFKRTWNNLIYWAIYKLILIPEEIIFLCANVSCGYILIIELIRQDPI